MSLQSQLEPDGVILVNGDYLDPMLGIFFDGRICKGSCQTGEDVRWLDSCRFDRAATQRHSVRFTRAF